MENSTRKYGKYIATLAFIAAIASGAGDSAQAAAMNAAAETEIVTAVADAGTDGFALEGAAHAGTVFSASGVQKKATHQGPGHVAPGGHRKATELAEAGHEAENGHKVGNLAPARLAAAPLSRATERIAQIAALTKVKAGFASQWAEPAEANGRVASAPAARAAISGMTA